MCVYVVGRDTFNYSKSAFLHTDAITQTSKTDKTIIFSLRSKRSCVFLRTGKPRNLSRSVSERVLAARKMGRAKTYLLADLDRFLGLPFHKNTQEHLLRRRDKTMHVTFNRLAITASHIMLQKTGLNFDRCGYLTRLALTACTR